MRDEARAVWRDMEEIAVAVTQFIHNWISTPPADGTVPVFLDQLRTTMKVLLARIELEERTLYTLYTRTLWKTPPPSRLASSSFTLYRNTHVFHLQAPRAPTVARPPSSRAAHPRPAPAPAHYPPPIVLAPATGGISYDLTW